jgi:hypothetical protein
MAPSQTNPDLPNRQDPSPWTHERIAQSFDHFNDPANADSQRRYAQQHGLPRSTLGYHLRKSAPADVDPKLTAFLRSAVGQQFLKRLVLALVLVFVFRGAVGLRLLALFLRLTQLDRFVASSIGALHNLTRSLEDDLATYAAEERARLAPTMPAKDIALIPDEHFHGPSPCLVAIEPAANFILVEQYSERRDADSWTAAISAATADLPVTIRLITSDRARGLIAAAGALQAHHLPELFHGQRDLARPLMRPLARQKQQAEKDLQHAEEMVRYWQAEQAKAAARPRSGRPTDYAQRLQFWRNVGQHTHTRIEQCVRHQEQARACVRGWADDYHPFDAHTGQALPAPAMTARLTQRLTALTALVQEADLGSKATEAVQRSGSWLVELVGALAWFWAVVGQRLEELDLPEEAERVVREELLAGLYWQARNGPSGGRTAAERAERRELAQRLLTAERARVEAAAAELVGLFARSSSSVEGRNGRLSLFQHGHSRLGSARLAALTVVHNYVSEREDGTTAAERFFGQKPREAFGWLLERLADLPRPAAKRPKTVQHPLN